MKFPFVIDRKGRGKLTKIEAINYEQALNKVLALNPGKRVTTQFAQALQTKIKIVEAKQILKALKKTYFKLIINTMDLVTAKVEAAKASRQEKKKIYINVDDEGECILSSIAAKNKDNVMAAFVNGSEVPLTEEPVIETKADKLKTEKKVVSAVNNAIKSSTKSKTTKMGTTTKKKIAVKKTTTPAKKIATKVKKEAVKKEDRIPRGNNMFLTAAEWKKVDALLAKESITFSAWSKSLVLAKIK